MSKGDIAAIYEDYFDDFTKLMNEEVSFVESPRSGYIIRSRPTILSCKALNSQRIRFKCNSKWLADDRHEVQSGQDEETNQPYQIVSVELTKQDVESELADVDKYTCQCYAYGSKSDEGVRSDSAQIKLAFIRKHFYQMPVSDRIAEGQTIQLPCVPPDGNPKPEVYWHRNGREIQTNTMDSNLILANDGSLIISAARLSDAANYTCEARNIANRRITEPAELTVYVDGEWSAWSPWQGDCSSVDCTLLATQLNMNLGDELAIGRALPSQRRTRACNNPPPLNGGSQCMGAEEDFRQCPHDCRIDGAWTGWTSYSSCNSACQKTRTRQCAAPFPINGGRNCIGKDTETVNCTESTLFPHCQQNVPSNSYIHINDGETSSTTIFNGGQVYVLASLFCFAFLLIVITLLIGALFCRKRKKTSSKTSHQYFPSVNDVHVLLQQQNQQKAVLMGSRDLKLMCTPPPAPYMQLLGPANFTNNYTLKSNKSYASGYSHQRKFTGSRVALIGNDHYSSSNSSSNSGACDTTPTKFPPQPFVPCAEDYATLYDCVADKYTLSTTSPALVEEGGLEDDDKRDDICCSLSEDGLLDRDQLGPTIVAAQVDSECSRIELRKCGASVLLSESTFPQATMIFLAVSDDLQDRPSLCNENETWLSSVVEFGKCENEGDDVVLRRPVVVTIEHYASIFPKENFQFILYADYGHGWMPVNQLGDENINTPCYVHVERRRFHVITDQFGRFLLSGKPKRANVAPTKRVRMAAYATLPVIHEDSLVTIRVYIIPDTNMAIENVRKQETEQNGQILSETREFLMQKSGNLCLHLEEVESEIEFSEDGYTSPCAGVRYVEIPETRHLWCSQNGLHCNLSTNARRGLTVRVRLSVSQRGSTAEKQILHLQFDPFKQQSLDKCSNRGSPERLVSLDFKLSSDVKRQLSRLLDTPTDSGQDWRGLANILDFKRYLQFFGLRPGCSPTSLILDLWESMNGSDRDRDILDLLQKLRIMGRQDAVFVLENFLSSSFELVHQ